MSNKTPDFTPNYTVHVGQFLKEIMEEMSMSITALAAKTYYLDTHLCALIEGKTSMSRNLAFALANVFDKPVEYWIKLQDQYDRDMQRLKKNA